VKPAFAVVVGLISVGFSSLSHANCSGGQLQFAFRNLEVKKAFAIFADFAGLRAQIDQAIVQSEPMNFPCTPWRVAADDLARRHNLVLKVEGGVMHVSRR
jgi:hypothetical protein